MWIILPNIIVHFLLFSIVCSIVFNNGMIVCLLFHTYCRLPNGYVCETLLNRPRSIATALRRRSDSFSSKCSTLFEYVNYNLHAPWYCLFGFYIPPSHEAPYSLWCPWLPCLHDFSRRWSHLVATRAFVITFVVVFVFCLWMYEHMINVM